ncbi:MAG: hypothetical protein Q8R15_02460 [Candidatus Micrarchaeota archaeon]|nr:hypothetical protein [Candidatus Micrarchaeota archaeon]
MELEVGFILNAVGAAALFFLFNKFVPLKSTSTETDEIKERPMTM